MGWPTVVFDEVRVEIVPEQDSKECGYIRFETDGQYIGAIDSRMSKTSLRKLKRAIDELMRDKK